MSNTGLIIAERSRDIGDFLVGRLIPFRKKRMIGPFIFIDHMGPSVLGPERYLDVDQHPHIGLATLTYLLEGEVMHADSLGTQQRIAPGSVNLMVAGKGVSHTERTPKTLRNGKTGTVHGYQIWIALPKAMEAMEPEFHHITKEELPYWEDATARFTLVAGEGFGRTAPVPTFSPLFMVKIETGDTSYDLDVSGQLKGEIGICIVSGGITACDTTIEKGAILVSKVTDVCRISIAPHTCILLFGGTPLPEKRHIYWNFVATDNAMIEKAKAEWASKTFPMMADDTSYVPLPDR